MKIVVIGAGISGLSAAIYARACGYEVEVLEMQENAGGLATSWQRDGYTFENCLLWLLGSKPGSQLHARWQELFDIDKLEFVYPELFARVEPAEGPALNVYRNVDQLEEAWLAYAPEDEAAIRKFASEIRTLTKTKLPVGETGRLSSWLGALFHLPQLPLLRELINQTCQEYGERFKNPVIRSFFRDAETSRMSAITMLLPLAWMTEGDCGYPIGGSQVVIHAIVERLLKLGGKLRYQARVAEIMTRDDMAVGVKLQNGEVIAADWVISAVDAHATIFDFLHGEYADKETLRVFEEFEPFPSYLQISFGIRREFREQAEYAVWLLRNPLVIDPVTHASQLQMRFFHYDTSFAPAGGTAVTCVITTRNTGYWRGLRQRDRDRYEDEKRRITEAVIEEMERRIPGIRESIDVTNVSTPATVVDYTGNWLGSMEGWLLTPESGYRALPSTLPGLGKFHLVGQWMMPGGGLPSGPLTARPVIESICHEDHVPFVLNKAPAEKQARSA